MVEAKITSLMQAAGQNLNAKRAEVVKAFENATVQEMKNIVTKICTDNSVMVPGKVVLNVLATEKTQSMTTDEKRDMVKHAIDQIQPRQRFFAIEDAIFRRALAKVFAEEDEEFKPASYLLRDIVYENEEEFTEEKLDDELGLADLYFEDNNPFKAEEHIHKATRWIGQTAKPEQKQRYQIIKGRIQDTKGDFLNAAQTYYRAAIGTEFDQDLLAWSLKAAILAPSGPQKSRLLAVLHNDERLKSNQFYDLLAKMFKGERIDYTNVQEFKETLEEFQNVQKQGYPILERAVIEHNILCISKLYMNITFDELGNFLGISSEKAEEFVAKMVSEGRIFAVLDQQEGLIEFEEEGRQVHTFNAQIKETCEKVDSLMQDMLKQHPELIQFDTYTF